MIIIVKFLNNVSPNIFDDRNCIEFESLINNTGIRKVYFKFVSGDISRQETTPKKPLLLFGDVLCIFSKEESEIVNHVICGWNLSLCLSKKEPDLCFVKKKKKKKF